MFNEEEVFECWMYGLLFKKYSREVLAKEKGRKELKGMGSMKHLMNRKKR